MHLFYYLLISVCIIFSILPLVRNQHWIFRVLEFARFQVAILQLVVLVLGLLFFTPKTLIFWATAAVTLALIVNHVVILIPYTVIYKRKPVQKISKNPDLISIISVNVYQFSKDYQQLIDLINEIQPDILLTMESNQAWEDALTVIENDYPNFKKVPLENTYGMHFYSKLKIEK